MYSKLNFACFIILISFFFSISVSAQSDFEGKIALRISGDDETTDMDYFIKGENIRMEVDAEDNSAVILFNTKNKKTTMMMPGQNMYMEFDVNQYMPETDNDNDIDEEIGDIERTGEYKDINGYKSEKWIFKDEDNIVEAWMTDELGNFYMMMNPMDNSSQEKWKQKLQGNYFPMKVDVIEDGEKTSSMEVLSVNKMSLNEDLFKVAPGMQKFDMPNMNMFKQN
jgi:hypothetical protein